MPSAKHDFGCTVDENQDQDILAHVDHTIQKVGNIVDYLISSSFYKMMVQVVFKDSNTSLFS